MQLSSLQVHNFRGIREFSTPIELHEYTLLVGPNNSGKSTVIDALRAFYEKGLKFDEQRDFPKGETTDKESWIELEFQLLDNEHDSLPTEYQNSLKQLRVRKYLATDKKSPDGKTSMAGNIYAYQPDGTLATKLFYATKNAQLGKFGTLIYIPAVSKIDDAVKLTGSSPLKDLVADVLSDVLNTNPQYNTLKETMNELALSSFDVQSDDGVSVSTISNAINNSVESWNTAVQFNFVTPSADDIVKSMLDMKVIDKTTNEIHDPSQFGSGFQRRLIYTLISLRAKFERSSQKATGKDFQPKMTLLLFEEPEVFLHPQQQELLARELRKLAKDGIFQIVCSTHSPTFVSRNSDQLPSIVRMRRESGYVYKAQISKEKLHVITVDNIEKYKEIDLKFQQRDKFAKDQDDLDPQMEEIKYFMWLNPDRCSMFFARHVLLVEGYTEYALINRLIADGLIDSVGVYILECSGKFKMHAYMGILTALEIEHSVIFDDDQDAANVLNSTRQQEINTLIKDVASSYTVKQKSLSPDLETMLDIDMTSINGDKKNKQNHRKPQHVLYWYQQNKIDNQRLNEFCKLVNECIAATKA